MSQVRRQTDLFQPLRNSLISVSHSVKQPWCAAARVPSRRRRQGRSTWKCCSDEMLEFRVILLLTLDLSIELRTCLSKSFGNKENNQDEQRRWKIYRILCKAEKTVGDVEYLKLKSWKQTNKRKKVVEKIRGQAEGEIKGKREMEGSGGGRAERKSMVHSQN